jgi:hypothetical protein
MALAEISPDLGWKLVFVGLIAEISLIGVICLVWGLFRVRRIHFRPGAYRRITRDLVMWRMLEEDPTGAYEGAAPLVKFWAHGQGLSAITAGVGMVLGGLIASAAVLLAPLTAYAADTSSQVQFVLQPLLTLLIVSLQLLILGMIAGLIVGYIWAFGRRENPPEEAPVSPPFKIGAYRASWLLWLVLAAVALETGGIAVSVPGAVWPPSAGEVIVFFVLPAIAIAQIAALEVVARRMCRMRLAMLPGPPEAAGQRQERLYAFFVTCILISQITILPLLASSQYLVYWTFVPSTATSLFGFLFLLVTFGGMVVMGFVGKSGGQLGGSRTGWPWRRPSAAVAA